MNHRMHLLSWLAVVAVGCAAPRAMTVSDACWQTVPAAERASVETTEGGALAAAIGAEQRAQTAVAAARQLADTPAITPRPDQPPPGADEDALAAWQTDRDARAAAFARVDHARTSWLRANLDLSERRLNAATARVGLLRAELELARAEAVERHSDSFDSQSFALQVGRAQQAWYVADAAVDAARPVLDDATRKLSGAKAAYASLVLAAAPPSLAQLKLPPHCRW